MKLPALKPRKKAAPKPTGRRYSSVREIMADLIPEALPKFNQYILAQTAVRKLCGAGPFDPPVTLTHEEISALFETVPELLTFAHTSMS